MKEINPLEGWTKEQIKSTLKAHTKTELLKIAMQWRIVTLKILSAIYPLRSS